MFWNDIKKIKEGMVDLQDAIRHIGSAIGQLDERIEEMGSMVIPLATRDKFDDYMKNVEKLNGMVNELKGCVSLARSAVAERKEQGDHAERSMKEFIRSFENIVR